MDQSSFKENVGLKVGSLAVALLLWFHIATEKDTYERVLEVPIQVVGVSSALIVSAELPPSAQVRFRGRGKRLLTLPWRDVHVVVDASDIMTRGTRTKDLYLGNVRFPGGPDLRVVEIEEPKQVTIETDLLVTLSLPVKPVMDIQCALSYTLVGNVGVEPDSVILTGPESDLRGLTFVETDTLRLRRRVRDPIDQEIPIRIPDIYNLVIEPPVVKIVQDVQPLGERTFSDIEVKFEGTDDTERFLAQPRLATVTVAGGMRLLERLTSDDIRIILNLSNMKPDGLTPLIPRCELPPGISLQRLEPQYFRVTEY